MSSLAPTLAASDSSDPAPRSFPRAALGAFLGGFWALSDQAVLSLGNFLTSLALIRHLPPATYGVYALVFGTLLFLVSLHAALVTYPLSLKAAAASEGDDAVRRLCASSLGLTAALWLPLAIGLVAALLFLRRPDLAPWACAALLAWLLQETLRRTLMARLRHRQALVGDVVSYLGQAAAVWALAWLGALTLKSALIAIASTSTAAALIQAAQLRLTPRLPFSSFIVHPSSFLLVGRWMLLVNLMGSITVLTMPWTLKAFHGPGEVARFQSLTVLLGIGNPVSMGMVSLIVPAVAAESARGGVAPARRAALRLSLVGGSLLLPFYLLLLAAPTAVLSAFFGADSAYVSLATPVRLFVGAYALAYVAAVSAALLNGLGHSRSAFLAHAAAAAATVLVSLPLAAKFGLTGAVWAGLFPAALHVAVALLMVTRVDLKR